MDVVEIMNHHDPDDFDDASNARRDEWSNEGSTGDLVPEWQRLLNDDPLPQDDNWDSPEPTVTDAALDGVYVCDNCGEEIVIPLDIAAGRDQQYVEDCPVCCSPSVIHVHFDDSDHADVWAEAEQDRY
ncbi:hypothetical protein RE6C_02457 [Rhodopirellula europaea 6C]|uniref:CPXCG motif-containing cysteine-rich protein n=2 Tax=Rhodopirellula TaxID=265488 RepID=M2B3M3_9BACT|nr:hypothetical protein RE6C_02457 [Rhodopirellula europaea 6C]